MAAHTSGWVGAHCKQRVSAFRPARHKPLSWCASLSALGVAHLLAFMLGCCGPQAGPVVRHGCLRLHDAACKPVSRRLVPAGGCLPACACPPSCAAAMPMSFPVSDWMMKAIWSSCWDICWQMLRERLALLHPVLGPSPCPQTPSSPARPMVPVPAPG